MKKIAKLAAIILVVAMLTGLSVISASAEEETVQRVLFVNAAAANQKTVEETDTAPEHRIYTVNVDGKIEEIKILRELGYSGTPSFLPDPWFGLFDVTINADGYVEKTRAVTDLVQGFLVNAPQNGKIVLGAKAEEYTFAANARVFIGSKDQNVEKPEIKPADIQTNWDAGYWLDLNDKGEIETMYISITPNIGKANTALTDNIAKFDSAWGPAAKDGRKIEYNYFMPEVKDGAKYPLMIWFHGSGCGQYQYQSMYDYNPVANFASDEFQAEFTAGGAYVMTPRANETWIGFEEGMRKWSSGTLTDLTDAFFAALDDFIENNPNVDTDRIYVGGFSNGGQMTWLSMLARPDFFAAAFPNCPGGMVPNPYEIDVLSKFSALPIWQVHGIADPVATSVATTKIMPFFAVEAARTGTDTRFSLWEEHFVDPDGKQIPIDHLSWAATLNNMKMNDGSLYLDKDGVAVKSTLIEWLNEQTRSANLERAAAAEATREELFTDVNAGNWFYNYVSMLTEAGIVSGMTSTEYAPNSVTTLGQTLKLVMLAAGYEEQAAEDGEHWASGYLAAALEDGLLPTGGTYDLDASVSRLTVAQLAAKALKLETTLTESPFPDTDDEAVLAIYEAKIIGGDDKGNYNPDNNLTRAEMSKIVLLLTTLVK